MGWIWFDPPDPSNHSKPSRRSIPFESNRNWKVWNETFQTYQVFLFERNGQNRFQVNHYSSSINLDCFYIINWIVLIFFPVYTQNQSRKSIANKLCESQYPKWYTSYGFKHSKSLKEMEKLLVLEDETLTGEWIWNKFQVSDLF